MGDLIEIECRGGGWLRIKFVIQEDPLWLGLTRNKIFDIKPSRTAKKVSPILKFSKLLNH